jgi:hypothetical protein
MDDATSLAAVSGPQRVIGARFEAIQHRQAAMTIEVFAENLHVGGAQLFARVGNQPVWLLVPIPGGRGFTGVLRQVPHEGDRLFLKYLGRLEHQTSITYHAHGGNPNVA